MMLNNLALICADTVRTKAYLSILKKYDLLPSIILLLKSRRKNINIKRHKYFDTRLNISYFAKSNNIALIKLKTSDINNSRVIKQLKKINHDLIIFSGAGGQILKKETLLPQKTFLHAHPGDLPIYRGSTTIYYSLIEYNTIVCSAIIMSDKIDDGKVLAKITYKVPKDKRDIDLVYDPYIRAETISSVLKQYKENGFLKSKKQNNSKQRTYYIIHPVLKHLSIIF